MTLLNKIESIGNRLPHPTTLFVLFSVFVILLSAVLSQLDWSSVHPVTGALLEVKSLVSGEGVRWMVSHAVKNFVEFGPVGTVLVAMLGLGIAEQSGFLKSVLKRLVLNTSGVFLTGALVLSGILSSIAADAGYVVLIPLGGALFLAAGRHPLVGIAATFAGVSGGFSANLVVGPVDAILAGLTTEAAQLVKADVQVSIASNYYFMCALTLLLTIAGTWVTHSIVAPRLGDYQSNIAQLDVSLSVEPKPAVSDTDSKLTLTSKEQAGLRWALFIGVIWLGVVVLAILPAEGILRHPETGTILKSPFISGLIILISIGFALMGIAYGVLVGTISSDKAVIEGMERSISTMAGYIVLMFFAAQFVNFFSWSQVGIISAVKLAQIIKDLAFSPMFVLSLFIVVIAILNLLIGSASAKWALIAPIFVPVFILLGVSPEMTQAAYRVADSSTNIITPLMPYFGVVVAFVQKYEPKAGMGTLAAMMLPYSIVFLAVGSATLIAWYGLGVPLGF